MTAPSELDAATLGALYRRRVLSPVEVTRALLARIEQHEPTLNAMARVVPEAALAAAEAAEGRWRAGVPLGPLDGVPITIKDNIATAGDPTPLGTAAGDLVTPATEDSPPAARVREAGCVPLGKTTMPDLGMLASGLSSLYGVTRNPWDTSRNTSGSSAGAAAALAAGYAPLALGTDIGGSVRLPAHACGTVALKPSLGRVPIDPPYFGRVTGPMARTVRDLCLLMAPLSRPDPRDWMSLPPTDLGFATLPPLEPRGLRLGLLLDAGAGLPATPDVRQAVEAVARELEAAGAVVEPTAPVVTTTMMSGLDLFFRSRARVAILTWAPERRARLLPFLAAWSAAADETSGLDLFRAFDQVVAIRAAAVRATQPFDFLLSPTCPITAYEAEFACPGNDPARPFEHIAFTAPFNQSEQPAVSVPVGFDGHGLPIGLQVVGHRFDDAGVLRLALTIEAMRRELPRLPARYRG